MLTIAEVESKMAKDHAKLLQCLETFNGITPLERTTLIMALTSAYLEGVKEGFEGSVAAQNLTLGEWNAKMWPNAERKP